MYIQCVCGILSPEYSSLILRMYKCEILKHIVNSCLQARARERQSRDPAVLGCSFLWAAFTACCAKATMLRVLVEEPLFTWPPFWSIWLLKCSSWLEMLPGTTRSQGIYKLFKFNSQYIHYCSNEYPRRHLKRFRL